jgi:hypothetical protein
MPSLGSRLRDMLRSLVARLSPEARLRDAEPREAGSRRSANGASSFHLFWEMPSGSGSQPRLVEVSAVLEVVAPPRDQALYFWALQVDFLQGRTVWGGGHTGLQWNKRYPEHTAVNWGGYASMERSTGVLSGTDSTLAGFADDLNTLAYPWQPGRPYRFRVFRSPDIPGAWRSEVTDLESGIASTIRDLLPPLGLEASDFSLSRPMVWSEVFADSDAPSVTVRWSGLEAVDETGAILAPEAVRVNYQSLGDGGYPNTTVALDRDGGVLQITNTPRVTGQGARLALTGRPGPPLSAAS